MLHQYCEAIARCCDVLGWDEVQRQQWLMAEFGKQSRSLLTDDELQLALTKLRRITIDGDATSKL